MANLSTLTRKEQVLEVLIDHLGEWVDGPELANEVVGGSEGLKRLRELRDEDGYGIEARRHPDPERSIWQYRLLDSTPPKLIAPIPPTAPFVPFKAVICPVPDCPRELYNVVIRWGYANGKCGKHGERQVRV